MIRSLISENTESTGSAGRKPPPSPPPSGRLRGRSPSHRRRRRGRRARATAQRCAGTPHASFPAAELALSEHPAASLSLPSPVSVGLRSSRLASRHGCDARPRQTPKRRVCRSRLSMARRPTRRHCTRDQPWPSADVPSWWWWWRGKGEG